MRIVSGRYKGRQIVPPKSFNARPTTDFAKENLFNILSNLFDLEEVQVLDLFSGTGGISFEFASRGCLRVDAVELNAKHYTFIKTVVAELNLEQVRPVKSNAFLFLKLCKSKYDIIFADPPYEDKGIPEIPELVFKNELLKPNGMLIVEHSRANSFTATPHYKETRTYGSVNFSFFQ